MIGNLQQHGEPALGQQLHDEDENGGQGNGHEDQVSKVGVLLDEHGTGGQTVDGHGGQQQYAGAVAGDAQRHQGNQSAAHAGVVGNLRCPDTGIHAGAELLRLLAHLLGLAVGHDVGNAGTHTGQEADAQTNEQRGDDGLGVVDEVPDGQTEALQTGGVHLGHILLTLGVAGGDLLQGEGAHQHADHVDAAVQVGIMEGKAKLVGDHVRAHSGHPQTNEGSQQALIDRTLGQTHHHGDRHQAEAEILPGTQ